MNNKAFDVVVVIVNWERPPDTIQCIRSVLESQLVKLHIVVVDNGSRDDSIKQIRSAFPEISLIPLKRNLGFAGGFNVGIEWALQMPVPYIFLLNNDTVLEATTIKSLIEAPWDVSVPKILYFDQPQRVWAAGAYWRPFPPAVIMKGFQKPDGPAYNMPYPLDYATGCALMVKREVLEKINAFDAEFENYMEDYDFTYRVRAAGFTMGYVPEAIMLHKVSQTLGEESPLRWRFLGRNTVFFYRKENRFPIRILAGYLAWFIMRELVKGKISRIINFFKGVNEGFKILKQKEASACGKHSL